MSKLKDGEEITRHLFKGHFSYPEGKLKIKRQGIYPMKNPDDNQMETSIFQTTGKDASEVLAIGTEHVAPARKAELLGYVRFKVDALSQHSLHAVWDGYEHENHGSIRGWKAVEDLLEQSEDFAEAVTENSDKIFFDVKKNSFIK